MIGLLDPTGAMATGSVIGTIADLTQAGANAATMHNRLKQGSLTSLTSVARVEPITIVDSDCLHLDYLPDVLQSLQSIFSGYYMQAVSLIADVGNIQVAKVLDKLNPSRKPDVAGFLDDFTKSYHMSKESLAENSHWKLSMESYKWRLPTEHNRPAMEDEAERLKKPKPVDKDKVSKPIDEKAFLPISELANLSVGKMLNVTIRSNGQQLTIPIAIRLIVNELPQVALLSMLGVGSKDISFTERYYKWKAGRIDFIKDLILCQDLIKEQKKLLMEDKEGLMSEIMRRAKNNKLSAFMTKDPSMAAASNLFVISESTAEELNRRSQLDIDNYKDRQKIFESTYGMVIVVINREFQRINFYHRDLRLPTSVSLRDIKASNKNFGPDITDILNAYKKGESPTL